MSAQQSLMQATQSIRAEPPRRRPETNRSAGGLRLGPFNVRLRYPAADGYVSVTILFGDAIGPFSQRLMDWISRRATASRPTGTSTSSTSSSTS